MLLLLVFHFSTLKILQIPNFLNKSFFFFFEKLIQIIIKAALGGNIACGKVLIDNGADLFVKTASQSTVLHAACEAGHVGFVELILNNCGEKKIELFNAQNKEEATPFSLASEVRKSFFSI